MRFFKISVYSKIAIQQIKAFMIGAALLEIEAEKTNIPKSIFPPLNPYYYKIKKMEGLK